MRVREQVFGTAGVTESEITIPAGVTTAEELLGRIVRAYARERDQTPRVWLFDREETDVLLNEPRSIPEPSGEAEVKRAMQAFRQRRILMLVDDRQVESLDSELELFADSEVSFLRLTPLIGG